MGMWGSLRERSIFVNQAQKSFYTLLCVNLPASSFSFPYFISNNWSILKVKKMAFLFQYRRIDQPFLPVYIDFVKSYKHTWHVWMSHQIVVYARMWLVMNLQLFPISFRILKRWEYFIHNSIKWFMHSNRMI